MQAWPTVSTGGLRARGDRGLEVVRGVVGGSTGGDGRLNTPEQLSRRPVSKHCCLHFLNLTTGVNYSHLYTVESKTRIIKYKELSMPC